MQTSLRVSSNCIAKGGPRGTLFSHLGSWNLNANDQSIEHSVFVQSLELPSDEIRLSFSGHAGSHYGVQTTLEINKH